jgi:hypothetical protein
MGIHTSPACKYKSFNALIRINEPELLHEVFLQQLDPDDPHVELFERSEQGPWRRLLPGGARSDDLPRPHHQILGQRIDP